MVSTKFMVNVWVALLWVDEGVYSMSLLKKECLLAKSVTPGSAPHDCSVDVAVAVAVLEGQECS